ENEAGAGYRSLGAIDRAVEAGLAVILVHHSNKGGVEFRGSTAFGAEPGILIGLRRRENDAYNARLLSVESWYGSNEMMMVERDEEDGSFYYVKDVTR